MLRLPVLRRITSLRLHSNVSGDLKTQLMGDLKGAMKAGDKPTASVLRSLLSDINYAQKSSQQVSMMTVLERAIKRRAEAIKEYENGNRADLAQQEFQEMKLLEKYLPEKMDEETLLKKIEEAIAECQAKTPKELGLVMKTLEKYVPEGAAPKGEMVLKIKQLLSAQK